MAKTAVLAAECKCTALHTAPYYTHEQHAFIAPHARTALNSN